MYTVKAPYVMLVGRVNKIIQLLFVFYAFVQEFEAVLPNHRVVLCPVNDK
jgi:hypothetical protein